jgi:Phage tail assembly chaperone protein, TAC
METKNELRFVLDDVTYIINAANAAPGLEMALSLAPMLSELTVKMKDDGPHIDDLPIGTIFAHLADPSVKTVRDYLIAQVNVSRANERAYRFSDHYDAHMNEFPSHYFPVLIKSFGFQFGRFFRAGGVAAFLVPDKLRSLFEKAQV